MKHKNYETLNLIGYGLAKFDMLFVKEFGFKTKSALYEYIVSLGIADTIGTVKNRQDLFDPFFDNRRRGWWQKGDAYIHRKILIDSLFGSLDVASYARVVKLYLHDKFGVREETKKPVSPLLKSKFKQLQVTGQEAELFFMNNYRGIDVFRDGVLEDARLYGDGYDFQVEVSPRYFLAEVKGVRAEYGSLRMTENEFRKAQEYKNDYALVVVSNLEDPPKMNVVFDPTVVLRFVQKRIRSEQVNYHTDTLKW